VIRKKKERIRKAGTQEKEVGWNGLSEGVGKTNRRSRLDA